WSDFRILLALSRAGSVAGAAKELGVDASTVSRRLTALEEGVGTRLVLRGGRELSWTAEGRAALAGAEAMEATVGEVLRGCREAHRGADFLRVDNIELACQLVATGTGIGLLPAIFEETVPGLLRVFDEPVTSNTGWLVYHETAREKARVRAAVEAFVEFFET